MTPKEISKKHKRILAYCNRIREALGKKSALFLRRERVADKFNSVIGLTVGGGCLVCGHTLRVHIKPYSYKRLVEAAITLAPRVEFNKRYGYLDIFHPKYIVKFEENFDDGKYPELIQKG